MQIDGEAVETVTDFIVGAPKSLQMVTAAMKLKGACSLEEKFLNIHVFKLSGLELSLLQMFWLLIQSPYCGVGWFGLSLCLSVF